MTKMIRILLLDDTLADLKKLSQSLQQEMQQQDIECYIDEYSNSLDAAIYNESYDVYFLDIDMPDLDGISVAKRIRQLHKDALLIFVTNHNNLVFKSFEANPFQFIRKNEYENDFHSCMQLLLERLLEPNQYYSFQFHGDVVMVKVKDIIYFEKFKNELYMYTLQDTYRYRENLSYVEMQLNHPLFLRTHNSYLVNLDHVKQLTEKFAIVDQGNIPISRTKYKEIKEKYIEYLKGKI